MYRLALVKLAVGPLAFLLALIPPKPVQRFDEPAVLLQRFGCGRTKSHKVATLSHTFLGRMSLKVNVKAL